MVIKEKSERVLVLRLANPPANVLNRRLLETLRGEIAAAAADPAVGALVLASSYPRYFSTGLDLQEMATLAPALQKEHFFLLLEVYRALRALPKPTVAAIGGSALLGGWILAMACDFRVMTQDGKLSLSEIRIGLSPTSALLRRLNEISSDPRLVKELVMKGRTLRASEALAGGLVDRLVDEESLHEESLRDARVLAKQPAAAFASVKRALARLPASEEEALWRESREEFTALFETAEAQAGLAALREKRNPRHKAEPS